MTISLPLFIIALLITYFIGFAHGMEVTVKKKKPKRRYPQSKQLLTSAK